MTLADIKQASYVQTVLEEEKKKICIFQQEVRDIERRLGQLSGMSDIQRSLGRILEDMETERKIFDGMHQCLAQSLYTYVKHEENILDYTEEKAGYVGEMEEFKTVRIPDKFRKEMSRLFY